MISELCLLVAMFITGQSTLGMIVIALTLLGIVAGAIAEKESKGAGNKVVVAFNIPIAFSYLYFTFQLFQMFR